MIKCIRVNDIHSYLETDLHKYELSDKDSENSTDHKCKKKWTVIRQSYQVTSPERFRVALHSAPS